MYQSQNFFVKVMKKLKKYGNFKLVVEATIITITVIITITFIITVTFSSLSLLLGYSGKEDTGPPNWEGFIQ